MVQKRERVRDVSCRLHKGVSNPVGKRSTRGERSDFLRLDAIVVDSRVPAAR